MAEVARTARRITLFFVGCFTLATLALGGTAIWIASDAAHDQLDDMIAAESGRLRRVHAASGLDALQRALQRREELGVNTLGYRLFDAGGRRLDGRLEAGGLGPGWADTMIRDPDGDDHAARALTVALPNGLRLTVAAETGEVVALERTMITLFACGFGVMLLVGVGGGLLFGRAIRQRLEAMNATAVAIIGGDLTSRVPLSARGDEFDRLAATLNHMLDRTDTLIASLRQVSGDLAHDLRTPITRLRQRLERALAGAPEHSPQAAEIEQAVADTDMILELFAALLRIAEVESGALRQYFRTVALSDVVASVVESYVLVAEDGGRTLEARIAPGVQVTGDPELLAQMLVNLIENALRHTPPGSHVRVTLASATGKRAVLRVEDDGPGVAADQYARLTERFTRLAPARSGPGHGLGLNLVAAVVAAHDASLSFESNRPGLAAIVTLPLAAPAPPDQQGR